MAVKRFSTSFISESGQDKSSNFIAGYSPAVDEMDLIQRVTLSGTIGSVTFSNIPTTYQHLHFRVLGRTIASSFYSEIPIWINLDSGNNYSRHYLLGNGAAAEATGYSPTGWISVYATAASASSGVFGASLFDILDYSSTSKNKAVRAVTGFDNNGVGTTLYDKGFIAITSGMRMSTEAINSVTILSPGGVGWSQHSTFALYGVKA